MAMQAGGWGLESAPPHPTVSSCPSLLPPWLFPSPSNALQYSCLENPMTEEPGGLQSMGSQRVGRD